MADILVDDLAPGVRRVTFNRPESLNAFKASMYAELLDILETIGRDPTVRVVVLTGAAIKGASARAAAVKMILPSIGWCLLHCLEKDHGGQKLRRV